MRRLRPAVTRLASTTLAVLAGCTGAPEHAGNPVFDGNYADPEVAVLAGRYWIFPTCSAPYDEQLWFDAFSSPDLVRWTRHERVLEVAAIPWARRALWAPAAIAADGRYFLFFGANDLQRPGGPLWNPDDPRSHTGGIGVAVADDPAGPYQDYLGAPLIGEFHNDAQPIDQFVFRDDDGALYLYYGGWGHCNVARLAPDLRGFLPWADGATFREITPAGYVEGPVVFRRAGRYYFLWSEGNWGDASYRVAWALADSPAGPFTRQGVVLEQDPAIATGAGHNSVLNPPGTDDWYVVYHRRPIPNRGRDHRVTCIDRLEFDAGGRILPVKMTFEGVAANPLRPVVDREK
ncbi:MAG: glycoside hydrolase family 43 protein [Planctomycetes bacterium]|nr:glycoside hydrolase family 43 protein [Planctomycetota bacterium]